MLGTPKSKPKDLEAIARTGGTFRRMAARVPTYLTDLRENPAWLPMFLLARTIPFRRAHWLTAKPVPPSETAASSMFGQIEADEVASELKRTGISAGLTLPASIHEEIARFAHETPCFGNFDRELEFVAGKHAEAERRFGAPYSAVIISNGSYNARQQWLFRETHCFSMLQDIILAVRRN